MYALQPDSAAKPDPWHALADPTRRRLLDRLAPGPLTTSQLCEGIPMSRVGVMKHLSVLERAGLVIARRKGRLRLNYLNTAPLRELARGWLSRHSEHRADGIEAFVNHVEGGKTVNQATMQSAELIDVALEWPVAASVQKVWSALFAEPHRWWPAAHLAGPEGAEMQFEQRIGGTLREERADGGGIIWYTVFAIDPLRSVDLVGNLASRYGGPAQSLLHIEVAPGAAEGTSILKITDSVHGRIGPDLRASLQEGWQAILGQGLVAFLNREVQQ